MIQYRHKKFGTIVSKAKEGDLYYNMKTNSLVNIPRNMVEASEEWVKLGKPLFITEDGIQLYEGDFWWYVTVTSNPHIARTNVVNYGGKPENIKPVKRFSNEFAARSYANKLTSSPLITMIELEEYAKDLKISKTTLTLIKNKFSKK